MTQNTRAPARDSPDDARASFDPASGIKKSAPSLLERMTRYYKQGRALAVEIVETYEEAREKNRAIREARASN